MEKRSEQGLSGLSALYTQYKLEAKRKDIEFALSKEAFKTIVSANCHFCGAEPIKPVVGPKSRQSKYGVEHSTFIANGMDRVNIDLGFVPGNCISCCDTCKKIKKDLNAEEFFKWIDRVHAYSTKQQTFIPKSAKPVYAP